MLVSLAVSLFLLVYPVYVIRPFRRQGALELAVALAVVRARPIAEAAVALLAAIAAARYRRSRLRRKVLPAVAAAATFACAALSRINVYELMFHPVDRPRFIAASSAAFDGAEHVLAVRSGDAARAYPIRSISYHHVVNDRLAGDPIVATY